MKVAVIGAGWAGCAAAVALARQQHHAIIFEAAHAPGGRARAAFSFQDQLLDNGQHILIGAYSETLQLMQSVGIDLQKSLLALPLCLRFPDGTGLQLPQLPPPLDAAWGIATARGWSLHDKLSLLRAALQWRWRGFVCAPQTTVAQLCASVSARVMAELLEPLCISALNTPANQASGQVFLRVLQDSLFAPASSLGAGSTLLLPRVDLSSLFPQAALQCAQQLGAQLRLGVRVLTLQRAQAQWLVNGEAFDTVLLACSATEAARLVGALAAAPELLPEPAPESAQASEPVAAAEGAGAAPALQPSSFAAWAHTAQALRYEAIGTVYAHAPGARLAQPMLALRCSAQAPAQFVFDRGQLAPEQPVLQGVLAFVVSASQGERETLEQQVLAQGRAQLGLPALHLVQSIVEKRATFACTPGLERPHMQIAPGLLACGDYVAGPYPATLEGAVRSGLAAANALAMPHTKPLNRPQ